MPYPQKFVAQFQSFETCLLGMGGNIYGQAITDIRRLLHIRVQDIHDIQDQDIGDENYFDAEVIPLPLGQNRLNAQQHIQLCSVITSYRLIDIMARVSGVPSNGFEVRKGLCEVENKEPEVSAYNHVILKFY